MFYKNKKGDNKKTIPWEKNRAVFFSRKERETWHSYEGDGKSDRIALIYNLMTNNIRDVYKIEKIIFQVIFVIKLILTYLNTLKLLFK